MQDICYDKNMPFSVVAYVIHTLIKSSISDDSLSGIVRKLLEETDPDLCHYLDLLGVGDMTFCHR